MIQGVDQIKVHILQNPKNQLLGFASCRLISQIGPFYLRGLKIVTGQYGLFVSMPSEKDKQGEYRDHYFLGFFLALSQM